MKKKILFHATWGRWNITSASSGMPLVTKIRMLILFLYISLHSVSAIYGPVNVHWEQTNFKDYPRGDGLLCLLFVIIHITYAWNYPLFNLPYSPLLNCRYLTLINGWSKFLMFGCLALFCISNLYSYCVLELKIVKNLYCG